MANGMRRPRQSHIGLEPQEEKKAGVLPLPERAARKTPTATRIPPRPAMGKPTPTRRMPDEDRYPRSRAAYGMARGGTVKFKRGETVLEGYEYEGEGIVAKSNTPSKKHIKRNPVFQKKTAKKNTPSKKHIKRNPVFQKKVAAVNKGSTPSSKSRKINPIFKTKKAARGGKVK